MSTSPVIDLPTELVQRYHALLESRATRAAGRCDCNCTRCSDRAASRSGAPAAGTSTLN